MKIFWKMLMAILLVMAVGACTNEDAPEMASNPESMETQEPEEGLTEELSELIVKYKDKEYRTKVAYRGDSAIYLNEEYAKIYNEEIIANDSIAALVYRNENDEKVVEYYSSARILEDKNGLEILQAQDSLGFNDDYRTPLTRGIQTFPSPPGIITGRAQLFDDRNFKDRAIEVECSNSHFFESWNLKQLANFNDKTSSIKVWNLMKPNTWYSVNNVSDFYGDGSVNSFLGSSLRICLIGYHNSNFGGNALYCLSKPTGESGIHEDANLKDINWNDRISSIVLRIVLVSDIVDGHYPAHK